MKGLSYSFLRAICALVIGLVLVMFPDQAGDYFVITIGVIFLVPSLVSIIGYFAQSTEMRSRFPIEGVGSLLFGLWLIIMYNPQIQISAESETKRSIFREKDKTKRSKKESAQHSKSRNKSFVMTSVSAL